ncbi:MAG: glutaminase [Pseudomonadales bacterium]|nr:glutaminase [Pseudomonadales bacterium]
MESDLNSLLARACDSVRTEIGKGKVADYIPALAHVDPGKFGAAVVTVEGDCALYGDAAEPFSVQSISKLFTLTLALEKVQQDLWERVGVEASGNAFNSILQLEREAGIPRNPFINAGALVVSDVLLGDSSPAVVIAELLTLLRTLSGDTSVYIDQQVAASEKETGFRNASLANFLKSFDNLKNDVEDVLEVYFNQCALAMTCEQLARSALFLANGGVAPASGHRVVNERRARRICSIMLTCGHYDASGEFAFRVGLPGKSGVGGGIVAVVPGRAAITVWSPGLNRAGNSLVGTAALEAFVHTSGWNMF